MPGTFTAIRLGELEWSEGEDGWWGSVPDRWIDHRPIFTVPANAESMTIYVQVGSDLGTRSYDSSFGSNYVFSVNR